MSENKGIFSLNLTEDSHEHRDTAKVAKKAGKKPQTRMNIMVDSDKLKKFKIAAMKQGKTMSEVINGNIDLFLSNK